MKAKTQVLVVEDEQIIAEDMQRTLKNIGYIVSSIVSTGKDAIKEAEENKPDLVLMDIKLRGDIDGVEAAEQIRTRFDIPVIYVTAMSDEGTLQRAKITQPFGYIHKPIEEKELNTTIEMALYRHRMERKLRESEERYRNLFDESRDAIYITTRDGRLVDCNQSMLDLFGYTREEILEVDVQKIYVDPDGRKKFQEKIEKEGFIRDYEVKIYDKNRREMDCLITATVRRDSGGSILGYHGSIHDVTERKQWEDALKQKITELNSFINNIPDMAWLKDANSNFIAVNSAFGKATGMDPEYLINHTCEVCFGKEQARKFREDDMKVMKSRKRTVIEESIIDAQGNKVYLETIKSPILSESGKVVGTVGIARDITERIRAEEERENLQVQLIQAEKMAGIGTLASGIAHEFNNILQIVRGHMEYAKRTKAQEDIEEALNIGIFNTDRAAKIIRDLLAFSRQEIPEKKQCDIIESIESVLILIEGHLKKQNIEVVKKYRKIPLIEMNNAELQQVFLNMVMNARDAMMPKGGKLEISVDHSSENVEVSIQDTGEGIAQENLDKVFEPFYTTKGAVGGENKLQGTGLGLSVSYGIVQRHGGMIDVKSEERKGTTFTIKLPIKERGRERSEEKKDVKKREDLNVLVVDDREEIGKRLTKWLSLEGHNVKTVVSGKEAINLIKNESFDVVFLDNIMPGIAGVDLLEEIRKISPETRVIMITGKLMDKDLLQELRQKGASGFLQKPFKINDVMETIRGEI